MKNKKPFFLLLLILLAISFFVQRCRYHSQLASDRFSCPWAYSSDANAKLFPGTWQGDFKDPDGVEKSISLEIYLPVTEEERNAAASTRVRRRSGLGPRRDKRAFNGFAIVKSRLGIEEYEIYGTVNDPDFYQFKFFLRPADEQKRILPNFTLTEASDGTWDEEKISAQLHYVHHNIDGSSTFSSEGVVVNGKLEWKESIEEQTTKISLKRASP